MTGRAKFKMAPTPSCPQQPFFTLYSKKEDASDPDEIWDWGGGAIWGALDKAASGLGVMYTAREGYFNFYSHH